MPIDNSNIEQWVEEYTSILLAYTVVRVNDSTTAEDIVQETFISAWKNKESFKGEASAKNWLFKICKNKIIDHYRKKARTPIQYAEAENSDMFFDSEEHWVMANGPANWGINYDQPVEQKEFYNILELCKKRLQEMQQRVFILKYLEDMDSDEICKLLNISSSNYWVLIHRAKLQLRACLEKNWINL